VENRKPPAAETIPAPIPALKSAESPLPALKIGEKTPATGTTKAAERRSLWVASLARSAAMSLGVLTVAAATYFSCIYYFEGADAASHELVDWRHSVGF